MVLVADGLRHVTGIGSHLQRSVERKSIANMKRSGHTAREKACMQYLVDLSHVGGLCILHLLDRGSIRVHVRGRSLHHGGRRHVANLADSRRTQEHR